jgi:carboxylesterase type B
MSDIVVETATGKVRGLTAGGVSIFKGIPYGASVAGAARVQPAGPPQPWAGTRALAGLCDQLNATQTRYPGTELTLRYMVKEHQSTT